MALGWNGKNTGRNGKNSTLAPLNRFFLGGVSLCNLSYNENHKVQYYIPFNNEETSLGRGFALKEWIELIFVVRIGSVL